MSVIAASLGVSFPGEALRVSAYTIPIDRQPESDGTAVWKATTLVLVEIEAGGKCGTGWT